MTKKTSKSEVKYIHVVEISTGKSVKVVKTTASIVDKVEAGMRRNMSDAYSTSVSDSPTDP